MSLSGQEPIEEQPRILGLDVGERRVGIALSGPLGVARPLLTLGRTHLRKELRDIGRLLRKHGVVAVVVGNPLHMSGAVSPQARKVQAFAAAIRQEFGLPVHMWDERLTSTAANDLLDSHGYPRGPERKRILDQVAAVLILQGWLDAATAQRPATAQHAAEEACAADPHQSLPLQHPIE